MDQKRVFLAVLLFCGAVCLSIAWPLWAQQARGKVTESLERQGFALTETEREAVEAFWERLHD